MLKVWMTGTKVSDWTDDGEHDESHGWVNPHWSMSTLYDLQSSVSPVSEYPLGANDDETPAQWLARVVNENLNGVEWNGDETFYSADSLTFDYSTDETFSYALHVEGASDELFNALDVERATVTVR